jgi:hypothetical protein
MTDVTAKINYPAIQFFTARYPGAPAFTVVRNWQELVFRGPNQRWPLRRFWVPGGLLDSSGQEFVLTDILNLPKIPFWMRPIDPIFGSHWYLGDYEIRLVVEEPVQLDLEQYKTKLKILAAKQLVQGTNRKKLKEMLSLSQSFEEGIYVLWGKEAFELQACPWRPPPGSNAFKLEATGRP